MIKAVIFDIGGVLRENIDIGDFWKNKKQSEKLRQDFGTGKLSIREFIRRASKLLDIPEKDFVREYKKAYGKLKLKIDVFKIFKEIKERKYFLTDTNPLHTMYEKKEYGQIFKKADMVFLSQKMGFRKNDIRAFRYVFKRIKFKPEETVIIDDSQGNLDNARKIGMKTILFKNAKQLKRDLKRLGINI